MAGRVKLQPSDAPEEIIEVSLEVANMSATIKSKIEDLGGSANVPIPLHNVTKKILIKVVEFCKYASEHKNDKHDDTNIAPWYKSFCEVDQGTLFELILAGKYLDIKPLLDVTCKTVASMIKGKTPEEIRKTFNIKNNFTPEEEEKAHREYEWCS